MSRPPTRVLPRIEGIGSEAVIVYDVDEVELAMVRDATALTAGLRSVHLRREDAMWPADTTVSSLSMPPRRGTAWREYAIDLSVQLFDTLLGDDPTANSTVVDAVDIRSVALYDCAHAASGALYRHWVCEQIAQSADVKTVVWVSETPETSALASRTASGLARRGINVTYLPAPDRISRLRLTTRKLRTGIRMDARAIRRAIRAPARWPESGGAKPRLLFVENYPKTSKLSAAAAKWAEAEGDADVWFVVTRRDTLEALKPFGLNRLQHIEDIVPRSTWMRARRMELGIGRLADGLDRPPGPEAALTGPACATELAFAAGVQWRSAASLTVAFSDLFRIMRPDVAASTSHLNAFSRAAMATARRAGVGSYLIQHGLFGHDQSDDSVLQERFLVWGRLEREQRIARGVDASNVEVTGYAGFDPGLLSLHGDSEAWSSEKRVKVLYLPSLAGGLWVSRATAAQQLRCIVDAVSSMGDVELVVKPHPADRSSMYGLAADRHPRIRMVRSGNAVNVIRGADIVIVTTSGSALEACAMGKPVIALRTPGVRNVPEYTAHGAILFADDAPSLRAQLESLRSDAQLRKELGRRRERLVDDIFDGSSPEPARRIAQALIRGAESAPSFVRRRPLTVAAGND